MIWKEFKKIAEDKGVKDEDKILMIDLSGVYVLEDLCIARNDYGVNIFTE